jgi:hypothetical protein
LSFFVVCQLKARRRWTLLLRVALVTRTRATVVWRAVSAQLLFLPTFSLAFSWRALFLASLSPGARVFKGLHVLVNILFLLAGAGLIAVGAYVLATNGATLSPSLSNLAPLAIIVIVTGGVVFFISFLGCCGSCQESRCLLNFYSIVLILIISAEIGLSIYTFVHRGTVMDNINNAWTTMPPATRQQIEVDLKCCGWMQTGVPAETSGTVCTAPPWTYNRPCEPVVVVSPFFDSVKLLLI